MRTRSLLLGIGVTLLSLDIVGKAFAACDMSGIWTDNFGNKWYIGQANNNLIEGSVLIASESRNWRVSGNIDISDTQFTLQAQSPEGPVDPTASSPNFEYYSTSNDCSTASGSWWNDIRFGGGGTFSMSKTAGAAAVAAPRK